MLYQIQDLDFGYGQGEVRVDVLRDLNAKIAQGEFLSLTGTSGSGKSTLLNLLGLIHKPKKQSIWYQGRDLGALNDKEASRIRKYEMGFIFQDFRLIEVLTVEENVGFFLKRQGLKKNDIADRVAAALLSVNLYETRDKMPGQLSGGQRQRVGIARAIAKSPKVIIADEPTANLDRETSQKIYNLLASINQSTKTTIIMASHDPKAEQYANRTIHMDGSGQIRSLVAMKSAT